MADNTEQPVPAVVPPPRPLRVRARAAQALAAERRALRRSAFAMGAAVRSSATLSGLEKDSAQLARRTSEAVRGIPNGRIAQAMEQASQRFSLWTGRVAARARSWASNSRTISGLGIDAQRVRRRMEQRRESRNHRPH